MAEPTPDAPTNPADQSPETLAIPGCTLGAPGVGTQLARYRRLADHAGSVERLTGEVRIRFNDDLPAGLLEQTLEVERRCCPFIHADYDRADGRVSLTVETVDQEPALDSIFHVLGQPTQTPIKKH